MIHILIHIFGGIIVYGSIVGIISIIIILIKLMFEEYYYYKWRKK